jgi:hypothetical protein
MKSLLLTFESQLTVGLKISTPEVGAVLTSNYSRWMRVRRTNVDGRAVDESQ